ncbi:MAG: hypothetical protein FJ198_03845 [Gammaproteobacteria bacterium]|nr:hypothetical protein [Gammaproteobacteria bacterium]MBM4210458.1 hypothetical protein [Gammaproteobacteria bacterium]MBM4233945.1 hypothetical protein [Gammaproteobacteria bacterium]
MRHARAAEPRCVGASWAWLIIDANGRLEAMNTANQDNLSTYIGIERCTPLLGNDVCESVCPLPAKQ